MSSPDAPPGAKLSRLDAWLPLFLAAVTFLLYAPSLWSDLVYDARVEILVEGFITSSSNLPTVLSLQVLSLPIMLPDRPGHLLYLMGLAAIWGKQPWGYHLASNLLHAANAALLFVLLRRLVADEWPEAMASRAAQMRLVLIGATLVFAAHPLSVETVAAVNYSSDLLVALFTFAALLAVTRFRPGSARAAWIMAAIVALCAFAAVTCKESGLAVAGILPVYVWLYRRGEPMRPWLIAIAKAVAVTTLFLAARFIFASAALPALPYLGGSFASVFVIQPQLWALMFLKLIWPAGMSADYTIENGLPLLAAVPILLAVLAGQTWLALRSRLGALGMALFWLGLATVSNFVPLHRIAADRYYYLPLAGVAMEVTAVLLLLKPGMAFRAALAVLLAAIVPLAVLNVARQPVFATDYALWTDTLVVSPQSFLAHNNLAESLVRMGRLDDAIAQARRSIELSPGFAIAHNNLGWALALEDRVDEALLEFAKAATLNPNLPEAHNNLGAAYLHQHRFDETIAEEGRALALRPDFVDARVNLARALLLSGRLDPAAGQLEAAVALDPRRAEIHDLLGIVYFQKGRIADAEREFTRAVELAPGNRRAQENLDKLRAYQQKAAAPK